MLPPLPLIRLELNYSKRFSESVNDPCLTEGLSVAGKDLNPTASGDITRKPPPFSYE